MNTQNGKTFQKCDHFIKLGKRWIEKFSELPTEVTFISKHLE
jgi:hypothetical protein